MTVETIVIVQPGYSMPGAKNYGTSKGDVSSSGQTALKLKHSQGQLGSSLLPP
jgi:hypothetical protein